MMTIEMVTVTKYCVGDRTFDTIVQAESYLAQSKIGEIVREFIAASPFVGSDNGNVLAHGLVYFAMDGSLDRLAVDVGRARAEATTIPRDGSKR